MDEGMKTGPSPEEKRKQQEQEDDQQLAGHFAIHPEQLNPPKILRESEPEIAEFEAMVASFESAHSLEKLHAIVDLSPADAPSHPVREPARLALIPIVRKLNAFLRETNITPIKHAELKRKYKLLARAVGIINKNKVDHDI